MLKSFRCCFPSARCPLDESFHHQERFVYLFNSTWILSYCCGNGCNSNRAAIKFLNDSREDAIVHFIQTVFIHPQCSKSMQGYFFIDRTIAFDLCEITNATQQCICNSWCAT